MRSTLVAIAIDRDVDLLTILEVGLVEAQRELACVGGRATVSIELSDDRRLLTAAGGDHDTTANMTRRGFVILACTLGLSTACALSHTEYRTGDADGGLIGP